MKIAICFYGLVGSKVGKNGLGENLDPSIAYEYYKKHIIDLNDEVDIFIHSWSIDSKEKLVELYKPKKECIEKQVDFLSYVDKFPNKFIGLKTKLKLLILKLFKKNKYRELVQNKDKEIFRAYSRWYSSKKVLELKKEYEDKNNFKYDVIMVTRLDLGFFSDVVFDKYDMNYFYASHRNDASTKQNNYQANYKNHFKDTQFLDLWFFSNSENMDKFALLYNEIENYGVSPHVSSKQHVDKVIGKDKIKYTMYRWFDHELIRRKLFESNDSD